MTHLTDEQLAAHLDGPRSGPAFDAAARHLESCEACRAKLAELSALDADLGRALEHDPGEAYFASFADRVTARIAAEAAPARAAEIAREPRRGLFAWWNSPRQLALAGGALAVVVVAAIAVVIVRQDGMRSTLDRVATRESRDVRTPAATGAPESAPRGANEIASPSAPEGANAPMAASPAPEASARREAAAPAPAAEAPAQKLAAPQRVMEMKTLPDGEQVAVAPRDIPVLDRSQAPVRRTPSGFVKPAPTPMGTGATPVREERAAASSEQANDALAGAARAQESEAIAPAPTMAAAPAPAPPAASKPVPATERARSALQSFAKAFSGAPSSSSSTTPQAPTRALAGARRDAAPAPVIASPQAAPAPTASAEASTRRLCGIVTDAKQHAIADAVVSITDSGRSVSTDASGRFCLELEPTIKTIEVYAVGFRSTRRVVTSSETELAVTLAAVDVLGGTAPRGRLATDQRGRPGIEPHVLGEARDATALAQRERTEDAWRKAAKLWASAVEERTLSAEQRTDARWHVAEAWMNAWRIGHWPSARLAARDAVRAYLADAPAGPPRDVALGWQKELGR